MTDDTFLTPLLNRALGLAHRAVPGPWHDLLALKGLPRSKATEEATLELAHLAPQLVAELSSVTSTRIEALEEEIAQLQAELDAAENETADEHMTAENERLSQENDRLRAEVARLTAALNGTLVEGEPS